MLRTNKPSMNIFFDDLEWPSLEHTSSVLIVASIHTIVTKVEPIINGYSYVAK